MVSGSGPGWLVHERIATHPTLLTVYDWQSELAAKKIAAVLETNREHEALMEEYDVLR